MATLTLKLPLAEDREAVPARRGLGRRLLDSYIEARMLRAEQEMQRYPHVIRSASVKDDGYRVERKDVGALPFGR